MSNIPTTDYPEFINNAKQRILHQDDALEQLAVILHFHQQAMQDFNHYDILMQIYHEKSELAKNAPQETEIILPDYPEKPEPIGSAPIFLLGKTGSGKTHLVRELCQLSGVNFLSINATHLTNAGYKGLTVADVGQMLVEQAGDNLAQQLFSVIFFDEFDKLFMPMNDYQASYRHGLATELLTLLEGTSLFPVKDNQGIDSRYMLFILGGSFGLHQNNQQPIGFLAENQIDNTPKNQLDFLKMGFFEELAGRIGQVISLAPLNKTMLMDILKYSPSSPYVRLKKQVHQNIRELEITDDFIEYLIDTHQQDIEKFGVRGLYQAFNALPYRHQILHSIAMKKVILRYIINKQGLICQDIDSVEYNEAEQQIIAYEQQSKKNAGLFSKLFG